MHSPITSLVIFFFFVSLNALSLPPSLSLLTDPTSVTDLLNGTSSNLTISPPQCSFSYGVDLEFKSCFNAWQKIERSTHEWVFRSRQGVITEDMPVPFRYMSDDGHCAIDVDLPQGVAQDTSDGLTISEQAGNVLIKCVNLAKLGGSVGIPSEYSNSVCPALFPSIEDD